MLKALWTASTGMGAQQLNIDVISNNLANANTTGYKKTRAEYQDLLYQELKSAGSSTSPDTESPTGIQVGQGVKTVSTNRIFAQGNFQNTDNPLDVAIEGEGFFQIQLPDGDIAYTRAGALKVDSDGRIVNQDGYVIEPEIAIPTDTLRIDISADGIVSVIQPGIIDPQQVGNLELARFVNPSGLSPKGKNLFIPSGASGDPTTGVPGIDGMGTVVQGFLEMSNVSVVEEMVNLIVAQRAYELNSKSVQTSDEMLQTANQMKR